MKKKLLIPLSLLFFSLFFIVSGEVFAQRIDQLSQSQPATRFGLSISPPVAYLHVKPGEKTIHSITATNITSEKLFVTSKLMPFEAQDGAVVLKEDQKDATRDSYIKISNQTADSVSLDPDQKHSFLVEIQTPEGSSPQELHYSLVVFAQTPATSQPTSTGGIASNMIIASSLQKPTGSIELSEIVSSWIVDSWQTLEPTLVFTNTSEFAAQIEGSVKLHSNWGVGSQVEATLYPDMVLSGSTRSARQLDSQTEEPQKISLNPGFSFGPHTLTVTTKDGVEITKVIWFLPLFIIGGFLMCTLILAGYYKFSS